MGKDLEDFWNYPNISLSMEFERALSNLKGKYNPCPHKECGLNKVFELGWTLMKLTPE